MSRDDSSARAAAGLTLIEMLVTLAVFSLLATLLSQALFQVHRIERVLGGGGLDAQNRLLRLEQVRLAIEAALPQSPSSNRGLAGDGRQLAFETSQAPSDVPTGLAIVALELRYDDVRQLTQLVCRVLLEGQDTRSHVVQEWPGRSGRIVYIDRNGSPQVEWPSSSVAPGSLPSAVAIDPETPLAPLLIAQFKVGSIVLQTRRELTQE